MFPTKALQKNQEHNENEDQAGYLCCAAEVIHAQPHVKQTGRQGWNGKIVHRAIVIHGFHKRHCDADRYGWTSQRQRHSQEPTATRLSQNSSCFKQRCRLLHKCRSSQQVDVRIEHQNHHADRTAKRADFGKVIVASGLPAEDIS